jgi:predicted nuclease of restriction endonuclease-like (RecB) superfamily
MLRYGNGFSVPNLQNFRKFYLAYNTRVITAAPIQYPTGTELIPLRKSHPSGDELVQGFSPHLSWSHYRALMRVENAAARDFYEREAGECGWSKAQLERQIHSFYYDRIIANRGEKGLMAEDRERLPGERVQPSHLLKSPMVLEFLGLPDSRELHESRLEQAIIDNLQNFLLELGKGFSFVARQKRIRFGDDDFYIDLVFYNYILKCFLLIDLKMGKLTHADVGQMDGYVRLYEDRFKIPGDNPTIGLLLCSDKSEAVAKYSILNENRQIFASKYLPNLPTEEQLRREIEKERHLIESTLEERTGE